MTHNFYLRFYLRLIPPTPLTPTLTFWSLKNIPPKQKHQTAEKENNKTHLVILPKKSLTDQIYKFRVIWNEAD